MNTIKQVNNSNVEFNGLYYPTPFVGVHDPHDSTTIKVYSKNRYITSIHYKKVTIQYLDGTIINSLGLSIKDTIKEINKLGNIVNQVTTQNNNPSQNTTEVVYKSREPIDLIFDTIDENGLTNNLTNRLFVKQSSYGNNVILFYYNNRWRVDQVNEGDIIYVKNDKHYTLLNNNLVSLGTTDVNNHNLPSIRDDKGRLSGNTVDPENTTLINFKYFNNPEGLLEDIATSLDNEDKILLYRNGSTKSIKLKDSIKGILSNPILLKGKVATLENLVANSGDLYIIKNPTPFQYRGNTYKDNDLVLFDGTNWINIGSTSINVDLATRNDSDGLTITNTNGNEVKLLPPNSYAFGVIDKDSYSLVKNSTSNDDSNSLVKRDSNKTFKVGDPTDNAHPINLKYFLEWIKDHGISNSSSISSNFYSVNEDYFEVKIGDLIYRFTKNGEIYYKYKNGSLTKIEFLTESNIPNKLGTNQEFRWKQELDGWSITLDENHKLFFNQEMLGNLTKNQVTTLYDTDLELDKIFDYNCKLTTTISSFKSAYQGVALPESWNTLQNDQKINILHDKSHGYVELSTNVVNNDSYSNMVVRLVKSGSNILVNNVFPYQGVAPEFNNLRIYERLNGIN